MKKILFGLATLSLVFAAASCAKESVEATTDGQNTISISPVLGKQTKASETTLPTLKLAALNNATGIQVKSYWGTVGGSLSGAADVADPFKDFSIFWTAATSQWTYVPLQIWPDPDVLKYYAWYPKTTALTTFTAPTGTVLPFTTEASFVYTVKEGTLADPQEDLIAASTLASEKDVELQFSHLLSQINFAVQEVDQFRVAIQSITLNGVGSTATYTYGATADATPPYDLDPVGTWSVTSVPDTYSLLPANGTAFPVTEVNFILPDVAKDTTLSSSAMKNALMLLPQDFAINADAQIEVKFLLYITDEDFGITLDPTELEGGVGGNYYYTNNAGNTADPVVATATVNLADFDNTEWKMGKRYTYLMDFTNYLKSTTINFTVVELDEWENWNDDADDNAIIVVEAAQANVSSIYGAIQSLSSYLENTTTDAIQITVNGALNTALTIEIPDAWFNATDKIIIDFKGTDGAGTDVGTLADITLIQDTDEAPAGTWAKTGAAGSKKFTFIKQ